MKKLFVVLLMLLPLTVMAAGTEVGASCTISWTSPTTGGPVATYAVYTATSATGTKVKAATVTGTSVKCADLIPVPAGQTYVAVTAANVAGESAQSATIPFFVVTAPGAPTAVVVTP